MKDQEILQELGLENAEESLKESALSSINTVVELRVSGLIQDLMTEDQRKEFTKKSETEDKGTVMKWISSEIVNVDEMYEAALRDYLDEKKANR